MAVRRVQAALLVAILLGVAAAALAQPEPAAPFRPTKDSSCADAKCHLNWTPPLRAMAIASPPATAPVDVGAPFEFTVAFQQAWMPPNSPSEPRLVYAAPSLDISQAPSLRFASGRDDIAGAASHHVIPVDAAKLHEPQGNLTRIEVPPGPSRIVWTVVPDDPGPAGPDLTLVATSPAGNVTLVDADPAAGGTERLELAVDDPRLAGGNWTVGARMLPAGRPGAVLPRVTDVGFTLRLDADYGSDAQRLVSLPRTVSIPAGGTLAETFRLEFTQVPGPAEEVRIGLDMTAVFKHRTSGTDDVENIAMDPMVLAVRSVDGRPAILHTPQSAAARVVVVNGPTMTTVSEAVGYASAFLFVTSIASGGVFGQASRRAMNRLFDSAKRRVAYHNFLSYGLTLAALVHMAIFLVPMVPGEGGLHRPSEQFQWSLGVVWGGLAMVGMLGLGLTGALQVPMIRRWSYPAWRRWHLASTVAAIAFTLLHMVFDGRNFGTAFPEVQRLWRDPFFQPVEG